MGRFKPTLTLGQFLDVHELALEVHRRVCFEPESRYYAYIPGADIRESGALLSICGDGSTPGEAIQDYAACISGKQLVFDANRPAERVIEVPNLSGLE